MYSLLFQNKWFAAAWAAITLGGIYLTIPREDGPTPAAAIAGNPQRGAPVASADARRRAEDARRLELDEFNSEAVEPYGEPADAAEPGSEAEPPVKLVSQPAEATDPGLE